MPIYSVLLREAAFIHLEVFSVTCDVRRDFDELKSLVCLVRNQIQSVMTSSLKSVHIRVPYHDFKSKGEVIPYEQFVLQLNALKLIVPNVSINWEKNPGLYIA